MLLIFSKLRWLLLFMLSPVVRSNNAISCNPTVEGSELTVNLTWTWDNVTAVTIEFNKTKVLECNRDSHNCTTFIKIPNPFRYTQTERLIEENHIRYSIRIPNAKKEFSGIWTMDFPEGTRKQIQKTCTVISNNAISCNPTVEGSELTVFMAWTWDNVTAVTIEFNKTKILECIRDSHKCTTFIKIPSPFGYTQTEQFIEKNQIMYIVRTPNAKKDISGIWTMDFPQGSREQIQKTCTVIKSSDAKKLQYSKVQLQKCQPKVEKLEEVSCTCSGVSDNVSASWDMNTGNFKVKDNTITFVAFEYTELRCYEKNPAGFAVGVPMIYIPEISYPPKVKYGRELGFVHTIPDKLYITCDGQTVSDKLVNLTEDKEAFSWKMFQNVWDFERNIERCPKSKNFKCIFKAEDELQSNIFPKFIQCEVSKGRDQSTDKYVVYFLIFFIVDNVVGGMLIQ